VAYLLLLFPLAGLVAVIIGATTHRQRTQRLCLLVVLSLIALTVVTSYYLL
jgi:predicted nucleic acid-binding Zn ribbon protein